METAKALLRSLSLFLDVLRQNLCSLLKADGSVHTEGMPTGQMFLQLFQKQT